VNQKKDEIKIASQTPWVAEARKNIRSQGVRRLRKKKGGEEEGEKTKRKRQRETGLILREKKSAEYLLKR